MGSQCAGERLVVAHRLEKSRLRDFRSRVGTGSATFSSSPVASAGKIYLLSEDGDTYVVEAGDEYREVAKNSLGEMSLASPAADAESLYVRTQTKLYRMKTKAPKS